MASIRPSRLLLGSLLVLAVASCGGGDAGGPQIGLPASVTVVSGDAQTGPVGAELAAPLTVRVTDSRGQAITGTAVTFTIASGSGTLAASTATTDASGNAQTRWTLGTSVSDEQRVEARVVTATVPAPVARFTATPTAGPAAAVTKAAGDAQSGAVGAALTTALQAKVADRFGNGVQGATVTWAVTAGGGSVNTLSATTDGNGIARTSWTLGTVPGTNGATATVTGLTPLSFTSTAVPGPTASIVISPGAPSLQAGASEQLSLTLKDSFGNVITGRTVVWTSSEQGIVTVDATGRVTGVCPGSSQVSARVDGRTASIQVGVVAGTVSCPTVTGVTPATLTPGSAATISGSGFAGTAPGNVVKVDGVTATVTSATETQISITLPASTSFACEPTRPVFVSVTANGRSGQRQHPLSVATPRTLSVGQAVTVSDAQELRCIQLTSTGGRYVVGVGNFAGFNSASGAAFSVRGSNGAGVTSTSVSIQGTSEPARTGLRNPAVLAHASLHENIQRQSREIMERFQGRPNAPRDQFRTQSTAAAIPRAGDTLSLKIPNIAGNLCSGTPFNVRARVVYVGTKGIVLEDVTARLSGTMDSLYTALGVDFDTRQFPILETNFGNLLAYDANTDNDGHMYMLFSPTVNTSGSGNLLGFVYSGDLFDTTACPNSNRAEIFYGYVPTDTVRGPIRGWPGGENGEINRAEWFDYVRSVVIHESKHVLANANRRSRGSTQEEAWLEESTAVIAEELYARAVYGWTHRGNIAHRASMYCEVRPSERSAAECPRRAFGMFDIYGFLYTFQRNSEQRSPLGNLGPTDGTWYGSGWSLVRWAADHYGTSGEAAFFRALVQEPVLLGTQNLEARTGRPMAEMTLDWAMMLYLDDMPNFTPQRVQLTYPSWNLRDIFAGMRTDFCDLIGSFCASPPLTPRAVTFGNFTSTVDLLRGGSSALFELSGTQTLPQALELRGVGAQPLPTSLRVQIVRTQ